MYHFDRIADIVQFIIDTLHFIIDAVSDLQELRVCHPSFLMCQFVQPTERVFDIRPSNQLLEIIF